MMIKLSTKWSILSRVVKPFPALEFHAIVQPMKIGKLNSMGGSGKETLRDLIRKQPEEAELTPITEDEFWGAFRVAHRAGELSPELDLMAEALNRAEDQLAQKKK